MAEPTELQRTNQEAAEDEAEHTRPGPVYKPAVDIFENAAGITLLADMPGVRPDDLEVDLREGVLSLTGRVVPPEGEGEADVAREYNPGTFYRQFSLADTIDNAAWSKSLPLRRYATVPLVLTSQKQHVIEFTPTLISSR